MLFLILGIVIWSAMHFIPASAPDFRTKMIARFGTALYKAGFGMITLAAVALIIWSWPHASTELLYLPVAWGAFLTIFLTLIAFVLVFAPYIDNNFRRLIRHPQLVGIILWGVGHLFANGEARSVALFGGLTLWALLEIWLLNKRDGSWEKPAAVPFIADVRLLLAGAGFYTIFLYTHQLLFGVGPVPYFSS